MKSAPGTLPPEVIGLSLERKQIVLSDGSTLPISLFIDSDGKRTPRPSQAVEVIAGARGNWYRVSVDAFEQPEYVT